MTIRAHGAIARKKRQLPPRPRPKDAGHCEYLANYLIEHGRLSIQSALPGRGHRRGLPLDAAAGVTRGST